ATGSGCASITETLAAGTVTTISQMSFRVLAFITSPRTSARSQVRVGVPGRPSTRSSALQFVSNPVTVTEFKKESCLSYSRPIIEWRPKRADSPSSRAGPRDLMRHDSFSTSAVRGLAVVLLFATGLTPTFLPSADAGWHWFSRGHAPGNDGTACPPSSIDVESDGSWYWMRSPDEERRGVARFYTRYCIPGHGHDRRGTLG